MCHLTGGPCGHFRLGAGPTRPAAIPVVVLDNRPEPGCRRENRVRNPGPLFEEIIRIIFSKRGSQFFFHTNFGRSDGTADYSRDEALRVSW